MGETKSLRYIVAEGSNSAHCCFEASVLDTERPDLDGDGVQMVLDGVPRWHAICETFHIEDAEAIAAALNAVLQEPAPSPQVE